jgi:4-diphosphocytidyl-2C-methyl-D-erythritol kinase
MLINGALGAQMSGSGSSVFGIFDDMDKLLFCRQKLDQMSFLTFI